MNCMSLENHWTNSLATNKNIFFLNQKKKKKKTRIYFDLKLG